MSDFVVSKLRMNSNDILQTRAFRDGVILGKRHLIPLLKMTKRRQYADTEEVMFHHQVPACRTIKTEWL